MTFDHKATDSQEIQRISENGGFVMGGRVNGVLAVTRALGDIKYKDHISGSPYTSSIELNEHDSVLILACDGVYFCIDFSFGMYALINKQ